MQIIVGSSNPAKIKAAKKAAVQYWPNAEVLGVDVESGVSKMPISTEEVREGAKNRAFNALKHGGHLGLGMEGGMTYVEGQPYLTSSCVATDGVKFAFGGEILVSLPESIVRPIVEEGLELGVVIDNMTGQRNSKTKDGAIAFLTQGKLTRAHVFMDSVLMALAPFAQQL